MTPPHFSDLAAVENALAAPLFLVFKHSHRCDISAAAFREYEKFAEAHPDVPTGWLDVVHERPWSQRVAEVTGVSHHSPQALLIRDGKVAWHASHWSITAKSLAAAVGSSR